MNMKTKALLLCLAASALCIATSTGPSFSQGLCFLNGEGFLNVSGEYICTVFCPAGGVGKRAFVSQNGENLILTNDGLAQFKCTITGLSITCTSGPPATVINNCKELQFNNSTIWIRRGS
jgi:hypothetical protein